MRRSPRSARENSGIHPLRIWTTGNRAAAAAAAAAAGGRRTMELASSVTYGNRETFQVVCFASSII
jgi:hypothetical protein